MRTRWWIPAILILLGLVFIGQGTGLIQSRSAMTDDIRWAFAGVAVAAVGVVLALIEARRRRSV